MSADQELYEAALILASKGITSAAIARDVLGRSAMGFSGNTLARMALILARAREISRKAGSAA